MSLTARNVAQGDLNFIRDSFVKSTKQIQLTTGLDPAILRDVINRAILFGWKCSVLCESSEPDEIMAWQVSEPGHRRLLYLLRNAKYKTIKGLGMRLLELTIPKGPLYCAFVNPHSAMLFAEHGYDVKLRPYITTEIMSYE